MADFACVREVVRFTVCNSLETGKMLIHLYSDHIELDPSVGGQIKDRQMDEQMHGWTDRWMKGRLILVPLSPAYTPTTNLNVTVTQ